MRGALALLVGVESSPAAQTGSDPNRTCFGRSSANHLAIGTNYTTYCDNRHDFACCFSQIPDFEQQSSRNPGLMHFVFAKYGLNVIFQGQDRGCDPRRCRVEGASHLSCPLKDTSYVKSRFSKTKSKKD